MRYPLEPAVRQGKPRNLPAPVSLSSFSRLTFHHKFGPVQQVERQGCILNYVKAMLAWLSGAAEFHQMAR
jgi:hypothetical protein